MSSFRLGGAGSLDRDRRLAFTFDGKPYRGYGGDTLASALLAEGVGLVGRSFKYHRPRGVLTAGSEEPNALVELRAGERREPNTRATVAELFDGLEARSQNRWPTLRYDLAGINSVLAPVLVAGFYYKTFMWPAALWEKLYEPLIRRAAGLGRASQQADPDAYEKANAFCDVLIIGGGPAGLAAALSAGRSGARVILCDEDFLLGGRLNGDSREIDGESGALWARRAVAELRSLPEVRVWPRTTVFGVYDQCTYGAIERVSDHLPLPPAHQPRQRLWRIVAKRAVLAAGAVERPLVFGGNDRPGVMMASAVRTYLNRFRVAAGREVALFTTSDDGWKTVADLIAEGIAVKAVIDGRTEVAQHLSDRATAGGARIMLGARVVATKGSAHLTGISIRDDAGRVSTLSIDALAISGGWNPSVALSTHLGGRPRWSDTISAFIPGTLPRHLAVAGAAAGDFSLSGALRSGALAGPDAARGTGFRIADAEEPRADDELTQVTPLWFVAESTGKAFVDFQHDVTREDVVLAAQEGFRSVELLKRYTTLGMATDQGKTSNINGHAMMAALTERAIPDVGTTIARPPYTPVAIGALAGRHRGAEFKPTRLTAGHSWAKANGASFVEAGLWLRAQWFSQGGEDWMASVAREVNSVRGGVGVCDVSTLGKIDVQGGDACAFLERIYCNSLTTLPIGKVRYGLMLREDGFVFDDGTVARLDHHHFVISTTTANAAKVMQHLEHARQVLWPELDVQIVSITEQWAQYSIAGPRSRSLLERLLDSSIDLSNAGFPYLACAAIEWRGIPARLFRISFSGELAYELAVPARYGDVTVREIMAAGTDLGVVPYGLEALSVMRIEKGHVAGGELNGTTTAHDLGLGKMVSTKKDFIGRVLAKRPGMNEPGRPILVGVSPVNRSDSLSAGAHFLTLGTEASLEHDQGFVSSAVFSPTFGRWIGLGFLSHGASRHGERVRAYDALRGADCEVLVTAPMFYDPDNARVKEAAQ